MTPFTKQNGQAATGWRQHDEWFSSEIGKMLNSLSAALTKHPPGQPVTDKSH